MKYPIDYTLETERCVLRYPSRDDIPFIFTATQVPGFTDGMLWEPPSKEAECIAPHEANCLAWAEDRAYCFSIVNKINHDFLGRIAIRRQEQEDVWDFGFFTHPDHYGKGYMTESVAKLMQFGFEEIGAKQIIAGHALWNKASEAVLMKNGMRFLKHIPQGFKKKGTWVEENRLGITRAEWNQQA